MSEIEKKADALLDEKEKDTEENEEKKEQPSKAITDPAEQLKKLARGKIKLMFPFRAHSQDVTEIEYDFCALTGIEMADALDSVPMNNIFAISNGQALAMFAAAAEKCAPFIDIDGTKTRLYDARDIKRSLKGVDFVEPMKISKAFYSASSRVGSSSILNG